MTTETGSRDDKTALPRPVLWGVLAVAVVVNAITSMSSLSPVIGVAFGVLALATAGLLLRDHLQRRARAAAEDAGQPGS